MCVCVCMYTERRAESPTLCTFYNADFIIYSSMGSFYVPCVAMLTPPTWPRGHSAWPPCHGTSAWPC